MAVGTKAFSRIVLSSGVTSNLPSGSIMYLSGRVSFSWSTQDTKKTIPGGNIYIPIGKYSGSLTISNALLYADDGGYYYSYDNIFNFFGRAFASTGKYTYVFIGKNNTMSAVADFYPINHITPSINKHIVYGFITEMNIDFDEIVPIYKTIKIEILR